METFPSEKHGYQQALEDGLSEHRISTTLDPYDSIGEPGTEALYSSGLGGGFPGGQTKERIEEIIGLLEGQDDELLPPDDDFDCVSQASQEMSRDPWSC